MPAAAPYLPPDPKVAAAERSGIQRARIASLSILLALIVVIVGPIVLLVIDGVSIARFGIHFGTNTFTVALLTQIVEVLAVGLALLVIAIILYLASFAAFRRVQPGFTGPLVLGIVGALGFLLILGGVASYLSQIFSAVACSQVNAPASCVNFTSIFIALGAVLLGALLALIGWIGLIIGIYRIGKRYHSTLTKVGAILYIVPVLNIIAPILVFIGVSGIRPSLPTPPPPG
jgi:hypothetical protein